MIKNKDCIDLINDKFLIRDRFINRILISYDNGVKIIASVFKNGNKEIQIEFNGVQSFCLFIDEQDIDGYLISHYKLFGIDGKYYFSFDPYDEQIEINEEDNNWILCKEILLKGF